MSANSQNIEYRKNLFGKLGPTAFAALESALQRLAGKRDVELGDWIRAIREGGGRNEFNRILDYFDVDSVQLDRDIERHLSQFPARTDPEAGVSFLLDQSIQQALPLATIGFGAGRVTTGHILLALIKRPELSGWLYKISREFSKVSEEVLEREFLATVKGAQETSETTVPSPGESGGAGPASPSAQPALERFTIDLTERARNGKIDPIVERDDEVRQIIDILARRGQNNPVLVGEAGVGKTAAVEGFANLIAAGRVPDAFKEVILRSLDVGLLLAGAGIKGEFEQRLKSVIDEVQKSVKPIILFIDEVHTLIGAGGQSGTGDAANLLKPALARGGLRTIAATTWDEYRKHIEKDPALSRRFQQVFVAEPDENKAIRMLRASSGQLERHHKVQILDEAIEAAVQLSIRFIPARLLPDKAVSLLDTAAARVSISHGAVPARLEDSRRKIRAFQVELERLESETAIGINHGERTLAIQKELDLEQRLAGEIEAKFVEEKSLVSEVIDIRARLRSEGASLEAGTEVKTAIVANRVAELEKLKGLQDRLVQLQGESPMLFPCVDRACIESVVSAWTGIPVGRMARQDIEEILGLADILERRVIGQRHVLEMVAKRLQSSRAKLENPERPVAVFLFVGPSGTGKTETALALAETLYGGEQNLITINMAEFTEKHTVSTLKGAPPGYTGYGDGGVLTEAVRRRPYSVVLLDEVEKAHSDVHKMFFQAFDKGSMEDSEGRSINFRNCVIILTSNAAQEVIVNLCKDPELRPDPAALETALRVPLTQVFPDALLNRLLVIPFYPITSDLLRRIVELNLRRLEQRIRTNHKVPFTYTLEVIDLVARRCGELERGARIVEAMITNTILPMIGREVLARALAGRALSRIHVTVANGDFVLEFE